MTCHLCRHFKRPDAGDVAARSDFSSDEYGRQIGICKLTPQHAEKEYDDYCGSFSTADPGAVGHYFRQMHAGWSEVRRERAVRAATEKKLKEACAQIRALKAQMKAAP